MKDYEHSETVEQKLNVLFASVSVSCLHLDTAEVIKQTKDTDADPDLSEDFRQSCTSTLRQRKGRVPHHVIRSGGVWGGASPTISTRTRLYKAVSASSQARPKYVILAEG